MKRCIVRASRSFSSATRVSSFASTSRVPQRIVLAGVGVTSLAAGALSLHMADEAVSEPYTKQSFSSTHEGLPLAGLGVRVKYSYFSVYALALYGKFPSPSSSSSSQDDESLVQSLRRHWSSSSPASLVLVFQRSVAGPEVGQALKDSLEPRVGPELATQFCSQLTPHSLQLGSKLEMRIRRKKIASSNNNKSSSSSSEVTIVETYLNGSLLSSIESEKLADGLLDVYLSKETVSPTFRSNILQNARKQ